MTQIVRIKSLHPTYLLYPSPSWFSSTQLLEREKARNSHFDIAPTKRHLLAYILLFYSILSHVVVYWLTSFITWDYVSRISECFLYQHVLEMVYANYLRKKVLSALQRFAQVFSLHLQLTTMIITLVPAMLVIRGMGQQFLPHSILRKSAMVINAQQCNVQLPRQTQFNSFPSPTLLSRYSILPTVHCLLITRRKSWAIFQPWESALSPNTFRKGRTSSSKGKVKDTRLSVG